MEIKSSNNSNNEAHIDPNETQIINKNIFIKTIKEVNGISDTEAANSLEYFTKALKETFCKYKDVELKLVGLLSLRSKIVDPKDATNPKTGEKIQVLHSVKSNFHLSKAFKKEILAKNLHLLSKTTKK